MTLGYRIQMWIGIAGVVIGCAYLLVHAYREPLEIKGERYLDESAAADLASDEPPVGIGYSACTDARDDILCVQCMKESGGGTAELWIRCTRWGCSKVDLFDFGKYRVPAPACQTPWAMAVIERLH